MTADKFRKILFDRYAEQEDTFGDDWFESFFINAHERGDPAWIDLEWCNETDSGNFSSGDESEKFFKLSDNGFEAHWTESTFRGLQGPFEDYDEAVKSLGYDPATFPPNPPDFLDDQEE